MAVPVGKAVSRTTDELPSVRGGGRASPAAVFPRFPVSLKLVRASELDTERNPLEGLRGRLVELASSRAPGALSLACAAVQAFQRRMAGVAWISAVRDIFFPPDLAANGVDLAALPVVRAPELRSAVRAVEWLLRSGSFALLILDLPQEADLPLARQARLAQLARHYEAAVVLLTKRASRAHSMGSPVSLYGEALRRRIAPGRFRCVFRVLKDRRKGTGWKHVEQRCGPPGLY